MKRKKVVMNDRIDLLNLQYGVVFGAIFSLMFSHTTQGTIHGIEFTISESNLLIFFLLLVYFVLDWISANYFKNEYANTPTKIFLWSSAIWIIGGVIIYINSISILRYFVFSVYVIIIGLYDLFLYSDDFHSGNLSSILWMFLSVIKTLVGFIFFLYSLGACLKPNEIVELNVWAIYFASGLLFLKIIRFLYLKTRLE
ncbi:hypothetical protein ACFLQT_01205 [Bacteroidota bacterium]